MLAILEFIKKMQQELGDDAEVELRLVNGELEILVTWREASLHTRRRYSESDLFKIHVRDSEEAELDDFVRWSKSEHQAKLLQNKPADHVQYKQGDTHK